MRAIAKLSIFGIFVLIFITPIISFTQALDPGYYYYLCNCSETQNYTKSAILAPLKVNEGLISIVLSDELVRGIFFTNETGSQTNTQYNVRIGWYNNATWNYNASDNKTEYWITNNGTAPIDICQKANANMVCTPGETCGNYEIYIGNVTWSNSTYNNLIHPAFSTVNNLTLSYSTGNRVAYSLPVDQIIYIRYWFYAPPGVPSGKYNSTVVFKAVGEEEPC